MVGQKLNYKLFDDYKIFFINFFERYKPVIIIFETLHEFHKNLQ